MSRETEKRITEWVVWFDHNKRLLPEHDLRKQCEFLLRSVDGAFEVLAMALADIQRLEGRNRHPDLYLPTGFEIKGDLRRFG